MNIAAVFIHDMQHKSKFIAVFVQRRKLRLAFIE